MNPFVSQINKQAWVLPVSGMCLVLGFMISLAWVTKTTRTSRQAFLSPDQQFRVNAASLDTDTFQKMSTESFQKMSTEVTKLEAEKTKMENALASQSGQSKVLNDSLQDIKVFAGLTPVVGPGVVVTLRDSGKAGAGMNMSLGIPSDAIIHDVDVLKVVNELIASGAEAVAVNNHRVAGRTSFRCVGTTILVDDVKIAPPIVIRAIGDSSTLLGAMNMPGGVLAEIRQTDPSMVQIEAVKSQELPEFIGNTSPKFAKPPKDAK